MFIDLRYYLLYSIYGLFLINCSHLINRRFSLKSKKQFDINQLWRLQRALVAARKIVEKIPEVSSVLSVAQKKEALELLISANLRLENGNRGERSVNDIGTRALFPVDLDKDTGTKLGKIFNEFPHLKTLGGLVKGPFAEVETILDNREILCPLALRVFSVSYVEHAVQNTKPTLLSA